MDAGVDSSAGGPSVPPRSRRLERRMAGSPKAQSRRAAVAVAAGVILLAGLLWWALGSGSSSPTPSANNLTASSAAPAITAVRQATSAVTSAGTSMDLAMAEIHGLPTEASVAAAVDPYLASLRTYRSALSQNVLPASADNWRRILLVRTGGLITLLGDLPKTPSHELGTWIRGFYLQTANLQYAIESLQSALPNEPAGR